MHAIGLMSGTSLDGVDAALIGTDGERIEKFGPTYYRPYSEPERAVLRRALAEAVPLTERTARPGVLAEAETLVTRTHAEAVERLIRREQHRVERYRRRRLSRPDRASPAAEQADRADRRRTCAGQAARHPRGAGFPCRRRGRRRAGRAARAGVSSCRAIVGTIERPHPVAVLNIGGVANVTFVDGGPDPIACDTGPGNALIDDFMRARTGAPYDSNGDAAAGGKPDEAFIARI